MAVIYVEVDLPGYALVEYPRAPSEDWGDNTGVQIRADARLYGE